MLYKSSVSEREWEATILYNRNVPGAYCFPSPFRCVAIDLVYAFAVLCSALSITFPGETTTKKQGICFQSLWTHTKTERQEHNAAHTQRRRAHGEGNTLHRTFRKWEFDVNGGRQRAITFFLFLSPHPHSFRPHNEKNNLEAMVVGFLNTTRCWISVVCLYYT